jgi:hypothetical protein
MPKKKKKKRTNAGVCLGKPSCCEAQSYLVIPTVTQTGHVRWDESPEKLLTVKGWCGGKEKILSPPLLLFQQRTFPIQKTAFPNAMCD